MEEQLLFCVFEVGISNFQTIHPNDRNYLVLKFSLFHFHSPILYSGNYTCEQFGDARASVYLKVQGK